mmetsp:Transcript_12748/g.27538  ORF Transcript_12748/g.27538 Transcript_12748/m.27538 type:complete len:241 (-) Transcript_12748:120-842(-)
MQPSTGRTYSWSSATPSSLTSPISAPSANSSSSDLSANDLMPAPNPAELGLIRKGHRHPAPSSASAARSRSSREPPPPRSSPRPADRRCTLTLLGVLNPARANAWWCRTLLTQIEYARGPLKTGTPHISATRRAARAALASEGEAASETRFTSPAHEGGGEERGKASSPCRSSRHTTSTSYSSWRRSALRPLRRSALPPRSAAAASSRRWRSRSTSREIQIPSRCRASVRTAIVARPGIC